MARDAFSYLHPADRGRDHPYGGRHALGALAIAAAVSVALIAYGVIRSAEPRARIRAGAS